MDKFFKIVGIVVVAWIALGLIGWLLGALVKTILIVAVVAGAVWLFGAVMNAGRRNKVGTRL